MKTSFSSLLLNWYQCHKRSLPWRVSESHPYATWLSEIMLQQTTVATVIPYFNAFLKKWPSVQDLAAASLDDVLVVWQGLGYYSRARNLHKAAQIVAHEFQGIFPSDSAALKTLPGVGDYTSAAIISIAFEKPAVAIDGNVIRVVSRYLALTDKRPALDKHIRVFLEENLPGKCFGDFTQSLMELGATICTPKTYACDDCPLQKSCKAHALDKVAAYPFKEKKKPLPTRYATAFLLERSDGAILLRRRDESHMLGGMMEVPTTPWMDKKPDEITLKNHRPHGEKWVSIPGFVKHTFSHFHFHIDVMKSCNSDGEGMWVLDLQTVALPTVMKKIIRHGLRCRE